MGHIRNIKDESIIRCYEDVIKTIGWVLDLPYDVTTEDGRMKVKETLIKTTGVLLIIDDFETLSEVDKKKIVALSSKLDVSKHKMLITTRSQYMVGEEYYIENLDREQTIAFMKERFKQSCSEKKYKEFELIMSSFKCDKNCPYCTAKITKWPAVKDQVNLLEQHFKKLRELGINFRYFILSGNGEPSLHGIDTLKTICDATRTVNIFDEKRIQSSGNIFFEPDY